MEDRENVLSIEKVCVEVRSKGISHSCNWTIAVHDVDSSLCVLHVKNYQLFQL